MAEVAGTELSTISRSLEATRHELALAVADLESAAQELVTPAHWKRVALRIWRGNAVLTLAAGFGLGFWIGAKSARRQAV